MEIKNNFLVMHKLLKYCNLYLRGPHTHTRKIKAIFFYVNFLSFLLNFYGNENNKQNIGVYFFFMYHKNYIQIILNMLKTQKKKCKSKHFHRHFLS